MESVENASGMQWNSDIVVVTISVGIKVINVISKFPKHNIFI